MVISRLATSQPGGFNTVTQPDYKIMFYKPLCLLPLPPSVHLPVSHSSHLGTKQPVWCLAAAKDGKGGRRWKPKWRRREEKRGRFGSSAADVLASLNPQPLRCKHKQTPAAHTYTHIDKHPPRTHTHAHMPVVTVVVMELPVVMEGHRVLRVLSSPPDYFLPLQEIKEIPSADCCVCHSASLWVFARAALNADNLASERCGASEHGRTGTAIKHMGFIQERSSMTRYIKASKWRLQAPIS